MSSNIVLLTPSRRFIANRAGIGYQIPLGLVLVGGPLVDAGHRVRLVDNDVLGLDDRDLVRKIALLEPDCVLLGHTGSTASHPIAVRTARALKRALPRTTVVYGGVYPTYAAESILEDFPAIDVVVRGEGEETALELVEALEGGGRDTLRGVRGITWRDGGSITRNPPRPPTTDLDRFRPGWELVDWQRYRLFGLGTAAGVQFSRGCPLRCGYCGQWGFWRRWRHVSPERLLRDLELLVHRHGVRVVWFADENFAADREAAREAIEAIARSGLRVSINLNMTAASVVRDRDLMPLYKRAGVDNIVLGIESLEDTSVQRIPKDNSFAISREAVAVLRRNRIVSLVNIMYGLAEETTGTLRHTYRRLLALDPDVLNAVYLTPHHWTRVGRETRPEDVIQPDLARFTYRNPVLATPHLSPSRLFWSVKCTEALFHFRPRSLVRMFFARDRRFRKVLRSYLVAGVGVVLAEIVEHLETEFVSPGTLTEVPGYPRAAREALRVPGS